MKFYRVKKDTPSWKVGAIISDKEIEGKFKSLSDIWDMVEIKGDYYEVGYVIEQNPDWFERVYEVNLLTKTIYKLKEEAQQIISKQYQE